MGRCDMAYFLGVDTGGTCTDAVILDQAADAVIGAALAGAGVTVSRAAIRARARVTASVS